MSSEVEEEVSADLDVKEGAKKPDREVKKTKSKTTKKKKPWVKNTIIGTCIM